MKSLIHDITTRLSSVYPPPEARDMAWWILEEVTGRSRTELLTECKDTTNIPNLEIILARACKKEPIQYIFGHTEWYGLDLKLNADTLIPRPETAELVERITTMHYALCTMHSPKVLDIGTGSGCIALKLKQLHTTWQVEGIDISPAAIEIARENAVRNGLDVSFRVLDILSDSPGTDYDIVVSNPPYICMRERADMDDNVLDWEPHRALFVPDDDPLLFYRRIASLRCGQQLYFEINEAYGHEVVNMLQGLGYTDIQLHQDIYGKDRFISSRAPR